jgi:hypothetical protein
MKNNNAHYANTISIVLCFTIIVCVTSCKYCYDTDYYYVEISPNKYVPVKFVSILEKNMTIKYNGIVVKYDSIGWLNRPRTLMEYNGKLYVLALDASSPVRADYKWRAFEQMNDKFVEISIDKFPKSIAIINIWLPGDPRRLSTGLHAEDKLDYVVINREMDLNNKYFYNNDQARLWYMLEVTNSLEIAESRVPVDVFQRVVREYKSKYNPVRLTSMEMKPVPKEEQNF